MPFEGQRPKTAVSNFLTRHCGRTITAEDCHYKRDQHGDSFVATLAAPCFNDKLYVGFERPTAKLADTSAAERFLGDPDVLQAAANLAKSMRNMKRQVKADPEVAKRLKQQGKFAEHVQDMYESSMRGKSAARPPVAASASRPQGYMGKHSGGYDGSPSGTSYFGLGRGTRILRVEDCHVGGM